MPFNRLWHWLTIPLEVEFTTTPLTLLAIVGAFVFISYTVIEWSVTVTTTYGGY